MNFDAYQKIHALNWSTLKKLTVSPRVLKHSADNPTAPTDAMKLGSAIDCALLEPERFKREYVVQPDFGDGRTRAAKDARAAWFAEFGPVLDAGDAITISHDDRETILRCADSIDAHEYARELLAGKTQKTITWTHPGTGIKCKGRIDVCSNRVIDLKTTGHATMREILNDAARRDYHGQVAWYHDGATLSCVLPEDAPLPGAVFVQTVAPWDVLVLDMNLCSDTFEAGRALYERLILQYDGCRAADWWPGMAPEPVPWTLPRWKMKEE